MQFLSCIKALFCSPIPREIGASEFDIVRCVIYPTHFRKENIYSYCFLPPKNSCDTSLLRLSYSSHSIAKRDGIKLVVNRSNKPEKNEKFFKGLAVVNNVIIEKLNATNEIKAKIIGTPIDENNNYVDKELTVYKGSKGKPYHADLVFEKPVPDGEPATNHRKYSDELVQIIQTKNLYYEDKCPEKMEWCSPNITEIVKKVFANNLW